MIKFIVWGTGGRGKNAAEIFGTDRIEAFIDSNPEKIGKRFCKKPTIDFDIYKKDYSGYPILVSIVVEEAITVILEKEHIFYFVYNECPPELIGYGWRHAKKHLSDFRIPEKKTAVYGHTLYSVLVYEYLVKSGYNCEGLVLDTPLSGWESDYFHKLFPSIPIKEPADIDHDTTLLQTVSDFRHENVFPGQMVKNIFDWKACIPEYYNPKIARLHNQYRGRRCFIVATGPSLTFDDLETLHTNHEFCMSVNSIFCSFEETNWRPDQYVAVDVGVIESYGEHIRSMDVREKFIADASLEFDYASLTDEFLVYHSVFSKSILEKGPISDDFARYAYNTGTVTAVCLQLAMYEGFDEIYLLGCDASYFQTGRAHFHEPKEMQLKEYDDDHLVTNMLKHHINAYQRIKEYAERGGIKIYNATRGGYLEVFERVDFDGLFSK